MFGLIVSFIQSLWSSPQGNITEDVIYVDERARIQSIHDRLHHEIIQKKINKSILNGFVTRNMPEYELDGHWATCLRGEEDRDSEVQFQAENCIMCGEYTFPYPNDNEKIQCQCVVNSIMDAITITTSDATTD